MKTTLLHGKEKYKIQKSTARFLPTTVDDGHDHDHDEHGHDSEFLHLAYVCAGWLWLLLLLSGLARWNTGFKPVGLQAGAPGMVLGGLRAGRLPVIWKGIPLPP
ncbi:MAG: hypothetical protein IPL27_03565 [Lewinellaceae bacterium]|nr:hypothetical protein [Lewinellaceae bacterium]